MRQRILERLPREQTAAAVYGGTPSVAHTEALLRGTVFKGVALDEPLDAIVIGIPPTTPFMPRERPNPVTAAYLGLGLALRLWRNAPPIAPAARRSSCTRFPRRFPRPTQTPYRALFFDPRTARRLGAMRDAEQAAVGTSARSPTTAPATPATRCSRSSSGAPATRPRTGSVRCSSPAAATRSPRGSSASCRCTALGAALEMARGRGAQRIGYLLAPPYAPLVVGAESNP